MPIFSSELFDFLADLEANNDRAWFAANKKRYENHVKAPALAFIEAFAAPLAEVSPKFEAIPKVQGGSLFRIYRDTRFSKDKTPYKTHVAMNFRHEDAGGDVHAPGYYLQLSTSGCMVGGGMWMPPNPVLNQVRDKIVAESDRWADVHRRVAADGYAPMESDNDLKRVPRGYDKTHVHAEDLKRKSYALSRAIPREQVLDDDFPRTLAGYYAMMEPWVRFVCEGVGVAY
jgi:uncharacterized protein (TIGR02453 family)